MHPNDRPPSVGSFRELILSTGPLSLWPSLEGRTYLEQIAPINRLLGLIAVVLLVLAFVVTLLASTQATPVTIAAAT